MGDTSDRDSAEGMGPAHAVAHIAAVLARQRARDDADQPSTPSEPSQAAAEEAVASAGGARAFLTALALLRQVRSEIGTWESELIDAARAHGASWAELAPALGVGSRQAAERRYLRVRPGPRSPGSTADGRVQAERDRRAADRAVSLWARANAAELRQLAGQIGGLRDLSPVAAPALASLRQALGADDAAELVVALTDVHAHLRGGHPALAERVDAMVAHTAGLRRESDARRR